MVFVHARKETVKSAQKLKEMAIEEGMATWFETQEHPRYQLYRKEIGTSRNREMKELFDSGFGIHHAGMLRSDRNMMEKMFEDQAIKVSLFCSLEGKRLKHVGSVLYIHVGLGCQFACTCCRHQRDASLRQRQRSVHGPIRPRCFADLWSCWASGLRNEWCRVYLHHTRQARQLSVYYYGSTSDRVEVSRPVLLRFGV